MEQTAAERTAGAVRAELARRRISGRDFAEGMQWHRNFASRRLTGQTPFRVDELDAVARYLGVPVAALLTEDGVAA